MVAELQVDRDVNYYLNQFRDLVTNCQLSSSKDSSCET